VVVITTFAIWFSAGLDQIDERFLDRARRWNLPDASSVPVAIVDVDDATTQALQFPFSRAVYARLLDVLNRGGARWVVFDIVFDTRRRNERGGELFPGEDSAFAAALRRTPQVTLAGQIPQGEVQAGTTSMRTLESSDNIVPLPEFLAVAPHWGAVQSKSESDGIVRRYVSSWPELDGKLRLALGTRALVDLGLADSSDFLESSPWSDRKGFRVSFFGGNRTFPTHSLLTVVDDSSFETPSEKEWGEHLDLSDSLLESGAFRGKIVLIGSSAMTNQDLVRTDLSPNFPGVELHAHAMGTWLLRNAMRDIPPWLYWPLLLALSTLALWATRRFESWWLVPLPGMLLAGFWGVSVMGLATAGTWAGSISTGILAGALCILFGGLARYVGELSRKREITRTFGQYVSPEVVKIMTSDPSKVTLGGQRGEISVLFSDFQGFTQLSEQLPPEQFVPQIGECFSVLSEHILEQLGTLDKYMGDAIMAEFGMPLPLADKALRSCRAAWRMQTSLARLRQEWASQGLPGLHMRVGVATGPALFGNMGSRQKFDYTALGDTVNLGSRLEGVNKAYGTRILIDGTTRSQAGEGIQARLVDRVRVVGKRQAVEVWELVHVAGEPEDPLLPSEVLDLWNQARTDWDAADFPGCRARLTELLTKLPSDTPSFLLLSRVEDHIAAGTSGTDWDGSVTLDHK
jgi:adenylate cyclase